MANGGESFDQMIERVRARRSSLSVSMPPSSSAGGGSSMAPFGGKQAPPFGKKGLSKDDKSEGSSMSSGKPFGKKSSGKSAPAQKALRAGRSFGRR